MKLPATFSKGDMVNVVIETPKFSRNKYAYQPDSGLYELTKVLPTGTGFPYDFGFISGTKAPDGDPLDALVIVETECFPGCFMQCRVIGVLKAEQKEVGQKKERNDRIIVVPVESIDHSQLKHIDQLNKHLMDELIHFFVYYNKMRDKKFSLLGVKGPKEALKIIRAHQVKQKK
jgi:inorganic pyrophosphatase